MTKAGYTHVLIPESLHSVLRYKSKEQKISTGQYIERLVESGNTHVLKPVVLRTAGVQISSSALMFFIGEEYKSPLSK